MSYPRFLFSLLIILGIFFHSDAQQDFNIENKILFSGIKKKKIQKGFTEWMSAQPILMYKPDNKDKIVLEGSFSFENHVKYAGSETISRRYSTLVYGKITFELNIEISDGELMYSASHFRHISLAKGDKIDFGKLTSDSLAPVLLREDYDAVWCNQVWESMKKQAKYKITSLLISLPEKIESDK